jgi:SAM-dependent methyltransferase
MNANTNSGSPSGPLGSGADLPADPVDWEARYRAGDTPWDRGAAPPLEEFLRDHHVSGEVLVPGCGTGHDVRLLASRGAQVIGLDFSETALAMARSHAPVAGERYEQGDLFALPEAWAGRFDWVVEHTCFCAIPPARRADYVTAVSRVLKPGGSLLAVFFLDPGVEKGPPHGATKEEIATLFNPFFVLEREWKPSAAFPEREGGESCQLRRKEEKTTTKTVRL